MQAGEKPTPGTHNVEKLRTAGSEPVNNVQQVLLNIQNVLPDDDFPWYKQRHLLLLNIFMIIPYLSSTTNGYDGSMLNGLQSMNQWQQFFNFPTSTRLGSLSNGVIFGQIVAFPIAPWLCDNTGRRFPIFLGSFLLVIGAVLQSASQNYTMFLISRMVIGFGGLIAVEASPMLVSELAYPTHRSVLVGYYNNLWYLGALSAAWITYGTYFMGPNSSWAWRIPSLLQGFFPLLQVLFVYLLPESPRYLVQKDRYDDARRVLVKYHAGGDENSSLVDYEMREIILHVAAARASSSTRYREFIKTSGNRHRLFIVILVPCMMQLSGNGLVAYYLHLVLSSIGLTSSPQQLRINGGLMVFNLGVSILMASLMELAGRRRLFLFSTVGMLISFVIWTILSAINQEQNFQHGSLGIGVVIMIFVYQFFYNAGLNGPPWVYVTEVLPTHLRAKGTNIMQIAGTCALIFNGYVNPIAMEAITWRYYILYCCVIAVEIVIVYLVFPETKGRSLEEVAVLFDGEAAFGGNDLKKEIEKIEASGKEQYI
ncbi:general substrate transporter [Talaromyces proteolyticus]|uniref:General substrate transporter n=1 Tax=Talaromyces proteolyticus TaxID=1131652 RepID=A0AAD4KHA9_9EURO|nr:general substrate transporter [Talaromyces proteolyticus]KAH8690337.1 general substrate transporter [Talaromyces proteolyticus]